MEELMTNFKRRQLYTMLNSRLARLSKDINETDSGLKTIIEKLKGYPEEQQSLCNFRETLQKINDLLQMEQDLIEARKQVASLKYEMEMLVTGETLEDEENSYW